MSAATIPNDEPRTIRFTRKHVPGLTAERVKFWTTFVVVAVALCFFGWGFLSEGVRINIPPTAITLARWKATPQFVQRFDYAHRLDTAAPLAVAIVFAALWSYEYLFRFLKREEEDVAEKKRRFEKVILAFAVGVIVFDVWMFYTAITNLGWGGVFSFKALIAALGYGSLLAILAHLMLLMREKIETLKKEHNS